MILAILTVLLLAGIALARYGNYNWEIPGVLLAALSGAALTFALIALPLNRMEVRADIEQFKAVRDIRHLGNATESVAFKLKVAESNQWLASSQYYARTTLFGVFYPVEIFDLEPMQ